MKKPFKNLDAATKWYSKNHSVFALLAQSVQVILERMLKERKIPYYRVVSRVKKIESFKAKAHRYNDPIKEIDDVAGIRVITFVEQDSEMVAKIVEELFAINRERSIDKDIALGADKVGYRAKHYVAELTSDRCDLPEYQMFKGYRFEVQIQTLLQHTWTEIEHDRHYKFQGIMPLALRRRFALLAGSLEIVDKEFSRLVEDCQSHMQLATKGLPQEMIGLALDEGTLNQYLETRFSNLIEINLLKLNWGQDDYWGYDAAINVVEYGITTVLGLNAIVPERFEEGQLYLHSKYKSYWTNLRGLLLDILIIHDLERYIQRVNGEFGPLKEIEWDTAELFKFCGKDIKSLCSQFGLKLKPKSPGLERR